MKEIPTLDLKQKKGLWGGKHVDVHGDSLKNKWRHAADMTDYRPDMSRSGRPINVLWLATGFVTMFSGNLIFTTVEFSYFTVQYWWK